MNSLCCKATLIQSQKKISHGISSPFSALNRRGLNPIKPVYDPDQPDGRLNLTASAFNQLSQYTSSPGRRGYRYAELAVFFPSGGRKSQSSISTSMSSLNLSSGACMTWRSRKFSDSMSNGCPVTAAMRSQWRRCIALLDIISSSGQLSLNSSIFCFRSMNACHSFRPFGSFLHLHASARNRSLPV